MKNDIIKTIAGILSSYQEVIFAYIFGSFTLSGNTQEGKKFSDIDVAVYLSDSRNGLHFTDDITGIVQHGEHRNNLNLEFKLENMIEDFINIPADVRVLNNSPLAFQYNIIKNGIVIVDRDKNLRADFEGLTFKKYFDYAHLRDEYLGNIINAPI